MEALYKSIPKIKIYYIMNGRNDDESNEVDKMTI